MTTLHIGNQVLDYTQHTDGETPVIFIHGIISCQYTWLNFPLRFSRYGRVITLSLPGHYPAAFPPHMSQATITDSWVGDTLAEAVRQLSGGKPAILIGHSTGGYASLAVAWRAPELVKCVISLAGFARGAWTGLLGVAQRLQNLGYAGSLLFDAMMTIETRSATLVDSSWQQCSYDKAALRANAAYQAMRPQIMSQVGHLDIHAMRLWFYQMRKEANLTPHLAQIAVPVLTIAGEQDSLVPPQESVQIARTVAHGTCVLLDKMDHALFVEQPQRVLECMTQWLDVQLDHED